MVLFVAVRGVCALLINHKVSEGPPELQSLAKNLGLWRQLVINTAGVILIGIASNNTARMKITKDEPTIIISFD